MVSAFETLGKILKLERELDYENKAVIRGLEALSKTWPVEAVREAPATTPIVEQIATLLRDYGLLPDKAARREQVAQILASLAECQQVAAEPVARPSAPPTSESPAPAQESGAAAPAPVEQPPAPPLAAPEKEPQAAAPAATAQPSGPRRAAARLGLDSPVTALAGVGEKKAQQFECLGIGTIHDLIYHFPYRYNDFSVLKTINQLAYGEEATIIGTVWETKSRRARSGATIVQTIIADGTATIEATWFNQPFLLKSLRAGRQVVLSGKIDAYLGRLVL